MWWRVALGTAAGIVSGAVVGGVLESASYVIFPPPPVVDFGNAVGITMSMDLMPMGAKIGAIVAAAIGSFVGGMVAVWIARTQIAAFGVAGVLLALGIWSVIAVPHPTWMIVAGAIALFVPALLGGYLVIRRNPMSAAPA